MNSRADAILLSLVALAVACIVACVACAFMGNYVWMTCCGMLACWCALMCVFVTVYVWR